VLSLFLIKNNNMTVKQIERLGFPYVGSKLRPRRFYCYFGEVTIPDYYNIQDIHQLIFDKGIEEGKRVQKIIDANKLRSYMGLDLIEDDGYFEIEH